MMISPVRSYVMILNDESLETLIREWEQFEIDGHIGDCYLRQCAKDILMSLSANPSMHVTWMKDLAMESYRELLKRNRTQLAAP